MNSSSLGPYTVTILCVYQGFIWDNPVGFMFHCAWIASRHLTNSNLIINANFTHLHANMIHIHGMEQYNETKDCLLMQDLLICFNTMWQTDYILTFNNGNPKIM